MHITEILELRAVCGLDALTYTVFLGIYSAAVRWWYGGWMSWMVAATHVATALITALTAIFLTSITLHPAIAGDLLPLVLAVLAPTVVVKLILLLREGRKERIKREQAARMLRASRAGLVRADRSPHATGSASAGSVPGAPTH